jgi:hypothetical protein
MAASQFNRYIWLVDTIRSAGRISRQDIDRRWAHSPFNEKGEDGIPERTFFRYKIAIEELFGIDICCDRTTGKYYLADSNYESRTKQWLLSQFALSNSLSDSRQLQGRILYEEIPQGTQYLTTITQAMSENKFLLVRHQKFDSVEVHEFMFAPYCLKVFKQRWYVLANSPSDNKKRVYGLDRIHAIEPTTQKYKIPETFDAEFYFRYAYGVTVLDKQQPEQVVISIDEEQADFLRTLPLHPSQKEIEPINGYPAFSFYLYPADEFLRELYAYGSALEVHEPKWLREDFAKDAAKTNKQYNH